VQQAPSGGCAQGVGVHVPRSARHVLGAWHCPWFVITHDPSGEQHTPGHGLGVQLLCAPSQVPVQAASVRTTQSPPVQQAPVGSTVHGFGVQAARSPCQMLGRMQPAWVRTMQVPSVAQHAPGQGEGTQLVPAPSQEPSHAAWVEMVQDPAEQQAPIGGGESTTPVPLHTTAGQPDVPVWIRAVLGPTESGQNSTVTAMLSSIARMKEPAPWRMRNSFPVTEIDPSSLP
jgi:hypothetical protein